jgi:hypothetical protein
MSELKSCAINQSVFLLTNYLIDNIDGTGKMCSGHSDGRE